MKNPLPIVFLILIANVLNAQPEKLFRVSNQAGQFTELSNNIVFTDADTLFILSNDQTVPVRLKEFTGNEKIYYRPLGDYVGGTYKTITLPTLQNTFFFRTITPSNTFGLWKSDGSVVSKVADFDTVYHFKVYNNELYFIGDDGISDPEIWKVNESGNMVQISEFATEKPFPLSNYGDEFDFEVFQNAMYFVADNGTSGFEIWKTVGVSGEISQITNFTQSEALPYSLTGLGDSLYFSTQFERANDTVYSSAGEPNTINIIQAPTKGRYTIKSLIAVNNKLVYLLDELGSNTYFQIYDPADGTIDTLNANDVGPVIYRGIVGDKLIYNTYADYYIYTLSYLDVNTHEITLVDQVDSYLPSPPMGPEVIQYNDLFIYTNSMDDEYHYRELRQSDLTEAGTQYVTDIFENSGGDTAYAWAQNLTKVADYVYFTSHVQDYAPNTAVEPYLYRYIPQVKTVTSTTSANTSNNFTVYPNPAKDKVFVKGINGVAEISITNNIGQTVKSALFSTTEPLNVSDLSPGLYFIKIQSAGNIAVEPLVIR